VARIIRKVDVHDPTRAPRVIEHIRSHITHITRQDGPIAALIARFGWKAFVTNATPQRLSLAEAVLF